MELVTIRRLCSGRGCIAIRSIHSTQTQMISPKGNIPSSPTPAMFSAASDTSDVAQTPSACESMPIVNPNGPHHLFIPGDLSKDGHYQHKYKDFILDLLPSGTLEQMCAVVQGRHIRIFPVSYVFKFFFPSAP